jgi:hypothetical protein
MLILMVLEWNHERLSLYVEEIGRRKVDWLGPLQEQFLHFPVWYIAAESEKVLLNVEELQCVW